MKLLALQDQDAELTARDGALVVLRKGTPIRTIPRHEVSEVHVYGGADLTAAGRNFLLREGIDTLFLTMDGRVKGWLVSSEGRFGERRLAQYRCLSDSTARLKIARALVAGKTASQYNLLLLRQRHLHDGRIADVLAYLRALPARLEEATDLDTVRGIEGQAANLYFGVFDLLLSNPLYPWKGRNRRPPTDPPNACLSFLYTLLCARTLAAIRTAGLDPHTGALHEASRGNPSLALDLAEEFRPLVDQLVLTLLNRRQLHPEDFAPPPPSPTDDIEAGAVYLGDVGRKIVLQEWARLLARRSPHPVTGDDWTLAGLMTTQAHRLRAVFEGEDEAYIPAKVIG